MDASLPLEDGHAITKLAIVDDHDLVRDGLQDILADEPDIGVIGEASNGREALTLCSRLQPDMVLMDVRMPEMDGLTATREIKQRHPQTSVLMVTMHENQDYLLEALQAGAAGYVLKDASRHELVTAVRRVRSGEFPLDPELAARLLKRLATEMNAESHNTSPRTLQRHGKSLRRHARLHPEPLSPREVEVLDLVRLGRTNRHIARELVISPGTVKRHVENIIAKLGVSDRTQAVVKALELGVLELSM